MLIGATARSVDEIAFLKRFGFHFAEIIIQNPQSRHIWWESGIKSGSDGFVLIAHGPLGDPCDDIRSLRDHYLPALKSTVDTAGRMGVSLLTFHLTVASSVSYPLLIEKQNALRELVNYGRSSNVEICLENVSESPSDLERVRDFVPGLNFTLDVGHAHLVGSRIPLEMIRHLGGSIRHVHLHDNRGKEDLHLSIGDGDIDFDMILRELVNHGYGRTLTLELPENDLITSKSRLEDLLGTVKR
ncbi:MAG: sugar phosphate isomerase/epimerase family protein [Desulfomonilaceae bacterium]